MKNFMVYILIPCAVAALVRAGFRFHYKEWVPASLTTVVGLGAIGIIIGFLYALRRLDAPLADSTAERIVMQVTGGKVNDTLMWALGFFLSAVGIIECPDALWTKWLSYPASFVLLILMALMLYIAMGQKLERVVADSSGITVLTDTSRINIPEYADAETRKAMAEPDERIEWKQVAAVKRIEVRRKTVTSHRNSLENDKTRHEFVLFDHEGKELLKIEEPLAPSDRYQRFLESIPRWTGLKVEQTSVTK